MKPSAPGEPPKQVSDQALADLRKLPGARAIRGAGATDFAGWPERDDEGSRQKPGEAAPAPSETASKPAANDGASKPAPSEPASSPAPAEATSWSDVWEAASEPAPSGTASEPAAREAVSWPAPSEAARRAALTPRSDKASWGSVFATTVSLWGQRRLRPLWPNRAGARVTALLAVLVLLLVTGGITLLVNRGTHTTGQTASQSGQAGAAGGSSGAIAAAAVRRQAAAWVASQVSGSDILACDPAMCAALQVQHIPTGRLTVLQPGQSGPLGADIVLATAAVRSLYGASLTSVYAPVAVAAFGSGPAQITVRVVAPHGAAAYRSNLASDLRERRVFGASLARNPHIHAAAAARSQLLAGQVDSRLLMNLAALATQHQVDILSFGGLPGRGASAGIPLRAAEIAPATAAGSAAASPQAMRAFLLGQQPLYHPSAVTLVHTASGRTALRVEFAAPTPLGLLGSQHS